jgi:aldose 1-epimerase
MTTSCRSQIFGVLPDGRTVEAWVLEGAGGLVVEVLTYGGIVRRLLAPDREGQLADVVLGFNNLASYVAGSPHFGAITGRVAGRLTGAAFELEGKRYELVCNDPPNHLHGGLAGFDKKIWAASPVNRADGAPSLRLAYRSPEGEEGYPGTVDVTVTYTVTADNNFLIETEATTDGATPFNLTHHSYFNLAGEGSGPASDHALQIEADEFVPTDEKMTLLGRRQSVSGQPADFRQPRRLGDAIPELFQNHGDLYVVRRKEADASGPELVSVACLTHHGSGRVLRVSTTESHFQFYTGAVLDGSLVGKSGASYPQFAGVCLECEGYSDGANAPEMGDIILRPGSPQRRTTVYAFSTLSS